MRVGGEGAWGARDRDVVLCGVFLYSRAVVSDKQKTQTSLNML